MLNVQLTALNSQTDDIRVRLAARIARRRDELRITQQQLGKRCGMSRWQIGRIERGDWNPGLDAIVKIASALDVTLSQLFEKIE